MKQSQLFKKLIKESIREVIREELPDIIEEALKNNKPLVEAPHQDFMRNYAPDHLKDFLPKKSNIPNISRPTNGQLKVNTQMNDPIQRILAQTKLTAEDHNAIMHNNMSLYESQAQNIGEMSDYDGPSNMPDFTR